MGRMVSGRFLVESLMVSWNTIPRHQQTGRAGIIKENFCGTFCVACPISIQVRSFGIYGKNMQSLHHPDLLHLTPPTDHHHNSSWALGGNRDGSNLRSAHQRLRDDSGSIFFRLRRACVWAEKTLLSSRTTSSCNTS